MVARQEPPSSPAAKGGASGRGIALALATGSRGCNVAVNYFRHREEAEQTADIEALGVKAWR